MRFNALLLLALGRRQEREGGTIRALSLNDGPPGTDAARYLPHSVAFHGCKRSKLRFVLNAIRHASRARILMVGHLHLCPLGLLLKILYPSLRVFLVVHGKEAWRKFTAPELRLARRAERILSVSAFTRDAVCRENQLDSARFTILGNALDPFFVERAAGARPQPKNGPVVLTVTRLAAGEESKGVDTVIRALPEVVREFPDLSYVVIGEGADRARLERLAADAGVGGRVRFAGAVTDPELPGYYATCDVFALPSAKEGFGIVFLEAMHFGKPCLGAASGGIPEVVSPAAGILVPYGDTAATAAALLRLLRAPPPSDEVRRQGERFSFASFEQRIATVLGD